MVRVFFLAIAVLAFIASPTQAAITFSVGDYEIAPAADQKINIMVSGDETIDRMTLFLWLSDIEGLGPKITSIDAIGPGTLFHGNNSGQFSLGDPLPSSGAVASVSTNVGAVGPNGLLAVVTIDATGVSPGQWDLFLAHPTYGGSTINGLVRNTSLPEALLIHGTLAVVPEPSTVVLALFGSGALFVLAYRKRRAC